MNISLNKLSGFLSSDEIETLRHTHEVVLTFDYDCRERNFDECSFVQEELFALGLKADSSFIGTKGNLLLKVYVPEGKELVS